MRLISKKTPFILAGAEVARRKIMNRRAAARRKALLPRVLGITALVGGVAAGVKYFSNPRRRWQAREQISTIKEKVSGNGSSEQVIDVTGQVGNKTETAQGSAPNRTP